MVDFVSDGILSLQTDGDQLCYSLERITRAKMRKQVRLAVPKESLQIPYPKGFSGQKSDDESKELFIGGEFRWLTLDEIELVQTEINKLKSIYTQYLEFGTIELGDDELLRANHEELDAIEESEKLPNTRYVHLGGRRDIASRVLCIREAGYYGGTVGLLLSPSA